MRVIDELNPVIRDVLQFTINDDRDPEDDLIVCWLDESEIACPELPRITMGF